MAHIGCLPNFQPKTGRLGVRLSIEEIMSDRPPISEKGAVDDRDASANANAMQLASVSSPLGDVSDEAMKGKVDC